MGDFRLSNNFISQYHGKQPNWGPLGYITFKRTYARPIQDEDRTEEWWETIKRVVEGTYQIQREHCERLKLPWNGNKAQKSAQEMYGLMWDFKFLPPGRGLWSMGTEVVKKKLAAPLYNCAFTSTQNLYTERSEPFAFLMDMSMLGVGVGFDIKGAGSITIRQPREGNYKFTVEDSREGWVELMRTTLDAYLGHGSLPKEIDYGLVRPYGALIKTFGGTASGPEPLRELVEENIPAILNPLIDTPITSTAIVDLFNAIGRCVVSGNVRRSAMIALGSADDEEFLRLKDPEHADIDKLEKWRWASNNSVFATIGMDYSKTTPITIKTGEIGYYWLDTAQRYGRLVDPPRNNPDEKILGCNPCSEVSLESYEFCNIPETFPARHASFEEYKRTLKFAYLYAKTVTLIPTHNARVNAVQLRNRKIGLSMSGIIQSIQKHGYRTHFTWCDRGYKYLKELDEIYSDWLCVPKSKKITSVKPSGSVSLLPGATPGIHFPYAQYYWRTIRMDAESELVSALKKAGHRVETAEGHNTVVVYFPVKEENFYKGRGDVSIWEQLEVVAQTQYWWTDNQISVTVTFKEEEAKEIQRALEMYETRLKSVSFLPLLDHGYKHAPYQPISKEEYDKAVKKLKPIKLKNFTETEGNEHKFCDSDMCEIQSPLISDK